MKTKKILKVIISGIFIIIILFVLFNYSSVKVQFINEVEIEFQRQKVSSNEILTESHLTNLPQPVKKYLRYTQSIGKSIPKNFKAEINAEMYQNPKSKPLKSEIVQYNFIEKPCRFFYLESSMFMVPVRVFHSYIYNNASMTVRLASLFNITNIQGGELSSTETVTLLNDMCVFAPAALIDKRLTWKEIDSLTVLVTFVNEPYKVSAILYFNEKGELINFKSDDRGALQDDGSLKKYTWQTPLRDYKLFDGRILSGYGEAIYSYPEGDFIYGKFRLKKIDINLNKYSE